MENLNFHGQEAHSLFGFRVPGININDLVIEQDSAMETTSGDSLVTTAGQPVLNLDEGKFHIPISEEFVGFGIRVPGVDMNELQTELDSVMSTTSSESLMATGQQLVAVTQGLHGCPSFLLHILAVLFGIGCFGSLLGFVHAGLCSTKCRQNIVFIHIFLANIGSILFIPFTIATGASGHWYFPNEVFMVLSFITILSQVVVAFQLTLLATLRCKQILSNEKFVTTNCTMMVSFFIWVIALPIAALSILDERFLAGTIKSDAFTQTSETEVLYVITFVFGSLIPVAIIFFCIVYSYRKRVANSDDKKIDCKLQTDIKEVMMMSLLYIVCCLPIQMFRLSQKQRVDGCGIPLNILICATALFTVLSPPLHIAYVTSSARSDDELISVSKDSEVALNVMNEFDEQKRENDDEKIV